MTRHKKNSIANIFKKDYYRTLFDEFFYDPIYSTLLIACFLIVGLLSLKFGNKGRHYTSEVYVKYTNGDEDTLTVVGSRSPKHIRIKEGDLYIPWADGNIVSASGVRSFKILSTAKEEVVDD